MKNKKGFTLIELIAVIIILAAIALVTFPALLNQISNTKGKINDATKELIISAAKSYVNDNLNSYSRKNTAIYCVDLDSLVAGNYLSNASISSVDGLSDKAVKVTYDGTYMYTIDDLSSCISTTRYYHWGTGNISDGLPKTNIDTDASKITTYRPFYLAFDSTDGKTIDAAYVCIVINDTPYCLKGGDGGAAFSDNKAILDEAFPGSCSGNEYEYSCRPGGGLYMPVNSNGYVAAANSGVLCRVKQDRSFECTGS